MSDSGNSFSINNSVTGGAQQQNIGQSGGEATMNVTQSSAPDIEQFLNELLGSIPEANRAEISKAVIEPLREIAASEPPDAETPQISWKQRIAEYAAKLEPYAPYVRKTIAAFAEGALKTIPPPASWVVVGVMEVVKDNRGD